MDGKNNGKPYEQMDDLGGNPTMFGNIHVHISRSVEVQYRVSKNNLKLLVSVFLISKKYYKTQVSSLTTVQSRW